MRLRDFKVSRSHPLHSQHCFHLLISTVLSCSLATSQVSFCVLYNRALLPTPEQLLLMSTFVPPGRYLGEFYCNEIVLKPWDWNTIVLESCQILLEEIESMTSGSETNPQMPGGKMVSLYSRFSFASSRYPPDRMEGLFCLVTEAIHYINFVLRTIKSSPIPAADKFSIIIHWTDKYLKNRMRDPIEVRTPISTLSPFPSRPMSNSRD
jgi:hypothetical protein